MRHISLPLVRAGVLLVTCGFLTACAHQALDLDAVNAFATTTAEAEQSFSDIAADFYASCVRSHQMSFKSAPVVDPDCTQSKADSKSWADANEIVISYVKALGDLAGGSSTTSDYGIPALSTQLTTSGVLNTTQTQAVQTFATDAVNVILAAERREALAGKMQQANASLKSVLDTLKTIASTYYVKNQLGFEHDQLVDFFGYNLVAPKKLGLEQIQLFEYKADYAQLQVALSNKVDASAAYVSALGTIGDTHDQLLQSVQSQNLGAAVAAQAAAINQLVPDLITLQRAFQPVTFQPVPFPPVRTVVPGGANAYNG
ncbi:MAG TPA: hypothetical protein VEV38_01700 [Candidatus Eremiobacteraceae bacterium]|nr:hypothetical protein [Candidatus Eremiobacteraceae bacterium]